MFRILHAVFFSGVLLGLFFASVLEAAPVRPLEEVFKKRLLDPDFPRDGVEDVVAYQRLVALLEEKSFGKFDAEWNAFRAVHSNSPFSSRSELLRKIQMFQTRPWEECLTNRYAPAESLDFYAYLKGREETNKLLAFIDRQIVMAGRVNTYVPIVQEVTALYKKVSGKPLVETMLAWTNAPGGDNRLFLYARLLYKADQYDEALALFGPLNQAGKFPETSYYLGVSHFEKFQYDKAEPHLKKYLDSFKSNDLEMSDTRTYARWIYLLTLERLKKTEEAYRLAGKYVSQVPDQRNYQILLRLAKYSFPAEYPSQRSNFLQKFPDSWTAYLMQRGDALTALEAGNHEEGLETLKKIYRNRQSDFRYLTSVLFNTGHEEAFLKNENPYYDYFYFQKQFAGYFPLAWDERPEKLLEQQVRAEEARGDGSMVLLTNIPRLYMVEAEELKWRLLTNREASWSLWSGIDSNWTAYLDTFPEKSFRRIKVLAALGETGLAESFLEKQRFEHAGARYAVYRAFYEMTGQESRRMRQELYSFDASRHFSFFPWELLRRLYPLYQMETVSYFCRLYGVTPSLALAVMREESHFNPRAVSSAGARGLMQIMDATGRGLFEGSGLKKYKTMNLLDPVENIHLGIRYLGSLLKRFNGDEIQTVASYNGGEGNVERWSKNNYTNRLHFALMIPYDETERYVQKVITAKWRYELLYPELKPK